MLTDFVVCFLECCARGSLHSDAIKCVQRLYDVPVQNTIVWSHHKQGSAVGGAAPTRAWSRQHMLHVMQEVAKLIE